jgi:ERCC4-type nuclease
MIIINIISEKDKMIFIVPGEKRLIAELEEFEVPFQIAPMDIGDIQIRTKNEDTNEYTDVEIIIERKEGRDLAASITDGRYEEQKTRIFAAIANTNKNANNVYYLIENFPSPNDEKFAYGTTARSRMWSAITNTLYRDKFHVFQSKNLAESAEFIISLDKSVKKFISQNDSSSSQRSMTVSDTALKKKKVSPDDFFMHSLMLIKGMQEDSAGAIVIQFPTFSALIKKYKSMIKNDEKPELLFKNTFRLSGKRKIGPVMSKKIYAFFEPELQ